MIGSRLESKVTMSNQPQHKPRPAGTATAPQLLGIYLNDHLAGATAGAELAKRMAGSLSGAPARREMERLAKEIAEDREALLGLMAALGVPVRRYKVYSAWIAEKLGRGKMNGRLLQRSPLSDLVELEMMRLGVEGKAAGWRTLRTRAEHDDRLDTARLDGLLERARAQADALEQLRVGAAAELLGAR